VDAPARGRLSASSPACGGFSREPLRRNRRRVERRFLPDGDPCDGVGRDGREADAEMTVAGRKDVSRSDGFPVSAPVVKADQVPKAERALDISAPAP
jgi:hypothetical protein